MTFQPFPIDALPDPVAAFVQSSSDAIGCDPSLVALPLLSALAAAIGDARTIELKVGWREPAIVWTATVGESGSAKSPALDAALRFTRDRQRRAMLHYSAAKRDHETDGENGPAPQPLRLLTGDTTTEALGVLLTHNPRGVLVAVDELAGWLGSFDRYSKGGGDAARWLELFGGRPLIVDRKTGAQTMLYVPRAVVSVCGSIQPGALRRALGAALIENGMVARVLMAMPSLKPKRWTEAEPDPVVTEQLDLVFDRLYGLRGATTPEGDEAPIALALSGSGKRQWVAFYNTHAERSADLTGALAAAASKREGYCARLALVIHLVRWAADDSSLKDSSAVDPVSVGMASRLVEWFGWEAERVYGMLSESEGDAQQRDLVEWIALKGGAVSVRQLTRGPRAYREADAAQRALDALVEAGLAHWHYPPPGPSGGAPGPVCRLGLASDHADTCEGGDGDESPSDALQSGVLSPVAMSPSGDDEPKGVEGAR